MKIPAQRRGDRARTASSDCVAVNLDHRKHDLAGRGDESLAGGIGLRHREWALFDHEIVCDQ